MTNTSPEHWFVPAGEILREPHYTSGNEVTVLADGETYFSHLSVRLNAMQGGYLHVAGYRITPGIPLLPASRPPGPLLSDQLTDLISRGVTVRLAVWYLPLAIMNLFYHPLPFKRFNHHNDNVDIVRAVECRGGQGQDEERGHPGPATGVSFFPGDHHPGVAPPEERAAPFREP